jgi:hypothetical protein
MEILKKAEAPLVPGNVVLPQSSWYIEMMHNVLHKGHCLCGRIFPNLDARKRTSSAMLHCSQRALQQLAILPIATATIATDTLGGGAGHGQAQEWELLGSMHDKELSQSS